MNLRRIIFVLSAVLLLISGLYSGERLFFIGFVLMCLVLLVSIVSVIYAAAMFKYLQTMTPLQGVKGETVRYKLQLSNDSWFPIAYLSISYDTIDSLLGGQASKVTMSLTPRTTVEQEQDILCRFRGRWQVGVKSAVIRDFFGLISLKLNVTRFLSHKTISLLVKPRIVVLSRLPMRRKKDEGPMETLPRPTSDTAMMSDIRKYAYGDQLKKIHWKLTARTRELMVKNYEESSLPDMLLYLDTSSPELERMERLNLEDTLVECATAVVHHLLVNHMPLSLIAYGKTRMQLRGSRPEHFQSFYTLLSDIPFDGQFPAEDVLTNDLKMVTYSGNLFLITWRFTDKLYDLLMLMNAGGLNITVIYVYPQAAGANTEIKQALEAGRVERMLVEMRNTGILVVDLHPGENLAERINVLT